MAAFLTTAELAKLLAISSATVRRWANAGLLPSERTSGGHRRFSVTVAERLARQHSNHLPGAESWVRLLVEGGPALAIDAALIAERSRSAGWYDAAEVIGRVLIELGVLWEQGQVTVTDTLIAASRLSRSLARIADAMPTGEGSPVAYLATAEGDDHTLGLALVEVAMRERGWEIRWIGSGAPTEHLTRLALKGGADALVISASISSDESALQAISAKLADACEAAGVELLLGGRGPWPRLAQGCSVVRTFDGLSAWMLGVEGRRGRRSSR